MRSSSSLATRSRTTRCRTRPPGPRPASGRGPCRGPRPVGDDPHGRRQLHRRLDVHRPGRQLQRRVRHGGQRDHSRRAATITADDAHQDLRRHGHVRRHRVHDQRPAGSDTVDSVTLSSAGAAATATVAGSPYPIVALGRRRHGPRELHDHLRRRRADASTRPRSRSPRTTSPRRSGVPFAFAGTEFSTTGLAERRQRRLGDAGRVPAPRRSRLRARTRSRSRPRSGRASRTTRSRTFQARSPSGTRHRSSATPPSTTHATAPVCGRRHGDRSGHRSNGDAGGRDARRCTAW